MATLPDQQVLQHVVDVHCHPTDASVISHETLQNLRITICAMATRQSDQLLVRDLALQYPSKIIPCFGYHPWFSYSIAIRPFSSKEDHYKTLLLGESTDPRLVESFERLLPHLPEPRLLTEIISELRAHFEAFPNAMLGEVGLDRSFRVPFDYFASPRELTPFTIPLEHQQVIVDAQIELAIDLGRNVSFHSVRSQEATVGLLNRMRDRYGERWCNISVDMHSCGFSNAHTNVFLSTSIAINGRNPNLRRLIAACAPDRILVESDYNNADMATQMTWEMLLIIAEVRGWPVEKDWDHHPDPKHIGAVRRLEENWTRFRRGNHPLEPSRKQTP
ncbi:TatD DNase family Scn1 [Amanita muscaria]